MTKFYSQALKCSLCLSALCLVQHSAKAEQIDSLHYTQQSGDLDEVTVTATKRSVLKKELASSVSIVGKRLLEQTQFQGLKDLNAQIPNVYIPDFGSSLSTPIFIRGIGSRRINMIGLYSDGVPLLEAGSIDTDYTDVRSVEFLRGPQGTIYGRGAMGGIINLRSFRPLDYQATHINLLAGQYGLAGLNAQSYQRASERLGFGASVNFLHKGGYYTNKFTKQQADESNAYSAKFSTQYRHNGWEVYGFAQYQKRYQGGYPYAAVAKDGAVAEVNYNQPSSYKRDLFTTGLSVQKMWANGLTLKSATSYQYLRDEMMMDQDFSPAPMITALQKTKKNVLTEELNISRKRGRYAWVTGVYGYWIGSDKTLDNHINIPGRNVSHVLINYGEPSYGVAVYHQSSYKLTDRLTAELGLRYDWERGKQNYDRTSVDHLRGGKRSYHEIPAKTIDRQFTPKFSLNYRLGDDQHLYASVLRGYQSSGFNVQFDRPEEQVYKPEYSWNYELGTHLSFLRNTLHIDASAFFIDWKQQQVQQPIITGLGSKITNAGQSRSIGGELAISYRPISGLNLGASYGYTHATFQTYDEVIRKQLVSHAGKHIPQVPRHTVAGSIDYTYLTGLTGLRSVRAGVQYRGLGEIYWDNANTHKQGFYSLLDAQLSLGFGLVTLELWGRNLMNTNYKAYQFTSQGQNLAQRGLPRHFGATVRLKF